MSDPFITIIRRARRCLTSLLLISGLLDLLGACAGLPAQIQRPPPATTLVAPADAPLARWARDSGVPAGMIGARALPQPTYALDARVQMMRRATTSIDLQTYHLADDGIGQLMLRELRDAALRGVRVRLLLDDYYTEGMDDVLLGLAAHANVELRLFNPWASARSSFVARMWQLAADFDRLNHRMHNKLLLADGVVALAGGRNLADEYFFRSKQANFIDFDVLMVGSMLLPELNALFDQYWNSLAVVPLHAVANNGLDAQAQRDSFERLTGQAHAPPEFPATEAQGNAAQRLQFGSQRPQFIIAIGGGAAADSPDKLLAHRVNVKDSLRQRFEALVSDAKTDLLIASPYYVPGRKAVEQLRGLRERGVHIRVFTNSTAASDEPLVNTGLARYRVPLLEMGVRLFEVASTRLKRDSWMQTALADATGRLHAKLGIIDRSVVLIGSMNLDPRSDHTNTEIGIGLNSPELAEELMAFFQLDDPQGVYELKLRPDTRTIEWVASDRDGCGIERHDIAPGMSLGLRLKMLLMSLLVSEDLL